MDSNGQAPFMARIRAALGKSDIGPPAAGLPGLIQSAPGPADERRLARIRSRSREEQSKLLERLIQTAESIHTRVSVHADLGEACAAILALAREKRPEWGHTKRIVAWDHPLIDALALERDLKEPAVSLHRPPTLSAGKAELDPQAVRAFREHAREAFIGITAADFCLAETATLVLKTRPGQPRSVSLLPTMHVAVIHLENLLRDLKELYTILKWDPTQRAEGLTNCTTFITGPSKTADIEANLVHGAHGPRDLHILVIKS